MLSLLASFKKQKKSLQKKVTNTRELNKMSAYILLAILCTCFLAQPAISAPRQLRQVSSEDETTSFPSASPDLQDDKPTKCVNIDELDLPFPFAACPWQTTLFPNPRQVNDTSFFGGQQALTREQLNRNYFNHALQQFTVDLQLSANCHPMIRDFLCFFYFPYCQDSPSGPQIVMPCQSLCLEVTDPDGKCAKETAKYTDDTLSHFNCTGGSQTVMGTPVFPTPEEIGGSLTCHPQIVTGIPDTAAPDTPAPATPEPPKATPGVEKEITAPPPPPKTLCDCLDDLADLEPGHDVPEGKLRGSLNSRTFSRNLNYNFAFKGILNGFSSHDCSATELKKGFTVFNFTVEEAFSLLKDDPDDCTSHVIEEGSHIEVIADEAPELEIGGAYAVAGEHREPTENCKDCFSDFWFVSPGVVSSWEKKYTKNMLKWVNNGNDARCS